MQKFIYAIATLACVTACQGQINFKGVNIYETAHATYGGASFSLFPTGTVTSSGSGITSGGWSGDYASAGFNFGDSAAINSSGTITLPFNYTMLGICSTASPPTNFPYSIVETDISSAGAECENSGDSAYGYSSTNYSSNSAFVINDGFDYPDDDQELATTSGSVLNPWQGFGTQWTFTFGGIGPTNTATAQSGISTPNPRRPNPPSAEAGINLAFQFTVGA